MSKNLLRGLSANAVQLVLNQLFGLVIFYLLSIHLSKESFGQLNLALAILLAAFSILSFGIDQVIIKKIAGGDAPSSMLSLYLCHVCITGLLFYGLLSAGFFLFPQRQLYGLVLLIGLGKLMIYFSTPFKQTANGMELFRLMGYLSIISNFVRCVCLAILAWEHALNFPAVVIVFVIGDILEFFIGVLLFRRITRLPLTVKFNKANYFSLVRESLPQVGVVLITSGLARFDWIFIGFMVSAVKLSEYSFAYKVFEMSTLPLLCIAPLLIPHFTKLFKHQDSHLENFRNLVRMEMILAGLVGLLLNICWAPLIDGLTAGKYGVVNSKTFFILTLCMPFLYLNNFLWTIYFAQSKLKLILRAFIITLVVNVAGDLLLIPLYQNEGAAIAFLLGCIAQAIFFIKYNNVTGLNTVWQPLAICVGCGIAAGWTAKFATLNTWLQLPVAMLAYLVLLLATKQIKWNDRKNLESLLYWQ